MTNELNKKKRYYNPLFRKTGLPIEESVSPSGRRHSDRNVPFLRVLQSTRS